MGEKAQETTRFWFDTRANLRREMEDRKRRFDDKTEVRDKIAEILKRVVGNAGIFDGVHVFTPNGDVPDDSGLRIVVLLPETWYSRQETQIAIDAVLDCIRNHGNKPRHRSNRLIFLAADQGTLPRLRDAARVVLAWTSIVDDVEEGRLNVDLLQKKQAESELKIAEDVLPRVARECYRWLLCPVQETPTEPRPSIEAFSLNTTGGSVAGEIERACGDNELVITTWSPIHLRTKLKELYWKEGQPSAKAMAFWEDTLRYLYLPRLKNRDVLARAIHNGAGSCDFFGIAYGQRGDTFEGFQFGDARVQFDDTLLLIEPEAAKAYQESQSKPVEPTAKPRGGFPAPGPGGIGIPTTVGTQESALLPWHSGGWISDGQNAVSPTCRRDYLRSVLRSECGGEGHSRCRRRVS
jgi:predicted AAA+ superfamily ATPase